MLKMILIISLLIVTALSMLVADCQTVGLTQTGTRSKNNSDPVLSGTYGAYEFYDVRYGLMTRTGSTNVSKWFGIQGSGSPLVNFVTNTPQYVVTITTNNFPAVNFEVGVSNIMRNDNIARLVNADTDHKFTIAICQCAENNGAAVQLASFGNTSASNNNGSVVRFLPHTGTPTTPSMGMGFDTNQAVTSTQVTLAPTTNGFTWYIASYSNGTSQVMNNLRSASLVIPAFGPITLNTFAVGGLFRTNNINGTFYSGRVSAVLFCTNAAFGSSLTNLSYYLSTNYSGGFYKTHN